MPIGTRKTKAVLSYQEGKPTVYKVQKILYGTIGEDALIQYICNSTNIPQSTVKQAVAAISEAIAYFVINGHRVVFDSFGAFYLKFNAKCVKTKEEVTADIIQRTTLGFAANEELANLASQANVRMSESLSDE